MAYCTAKPAGTVLPGGRTPVFSVFVCCSTAYQCSVCPVPVRTVATPVINVVIDITYQGAGGAVKGGKAMRRHTPDRNNIVVLPQNRRQGNFFIQKATDPVDGKVELFPPTPVIMSHTSVQFSRFAIGKAVMVRRIKFAPAMVVLYQVTTQSESFGKIAQHFKAAEPSLGFRG